MPFMGYLSNFDLMKNAGLYIHIPYCKSKCNYCDFYSLTDKINENYIHAVINEIRFQSKNWTNSVFDTIYFGGGTPSMLNDYEFSLIVKELYNHFNFTKNIEFTVECNPDDISKDKIQSYLFNGVNRISLGIQSLNDKLLQFLNRRHNSEVALNAINETFASGIKNISIDLIYGIPGLNMNMLNDTLGKIKHLPINHVSAYCLSLHEGTDMFNDFKKNKFKLPDDEHSFVQYKTIISFLGTLNINQYEVSNFALNGFISKHNYKYWTEVPYLGLGPSAHSFDGKRRFFNSNNLKNYIKDFDLFTNQITYDDLTKNNIYNEYLMNSLRTLDGINLSYIQDKYFKNKDKILNTFKTLPQTWYIINNDTIILTTEGFFVLDFILDKLVIIS